MVLVRDLAAALQPSVFCHALPTLLPRLLACASQQAAREVAVAADEALEQLLQRADGAACIDMLAQRLPAESAQLTAAIESTAALHAVLRNLRRVLCRLPPAAVHATLDILLPGLRAAYCSPLADVRKATVDCLVAVSLAVGDGPLKPHLESLTQSQRRLLDIYVGKALIH